MPFEFKSARFQCASEVPIRIDRALKERFPDASWSAVRKLVTTGKVSVDGKLMKDGGQLVAPGATIDLQMTAPRARTREYQAENRVLYCDPHVVIVNKPAGLSSVDHDSEPSSLQSEIRTWLTRKERRNVPPLFVVHRLDKVTSGVMMFARSKAAQDDLKGQFRAHVTGRRYIAVAHGRVQDCTLQSHLVRDRGDGIRGSTTDRDAGQRSVTHVRVLEPLTNCTLIECRLETGRTHQIRIQLSEKGHPLVGEPLYNRDYRGHWIECPRTLLHAAFLSYTHPVFRKTQRFETPLPAEFETFLSERRPTPPT